MKKIWLVILFIVYCEIIKSQDSRPLAMNKLQYAYNTKNFEQDIYRGVRIKLNKSMIFRLRTYSYDAIQSTLIISYPLQMRLYAYFNLPEYTITPAVSIRYNF